MKSIKLTFLISASLLSFTECSGKNYVTTEFPAYDSIVVSQYETQPMPGVGDVADDPAIWVNFNDPASSLIIGSNKKNGLHVYNLQGTELHHYTVGKINNVDIRYNFPLQNGNKVDIVAGSNRSDNSISIFSINPIDGSLTPINQNVMQSEFDEVYGFCLHHNHENGKYYAFLNDKNGSVEQWELFSSDSNKIAGKIVRRLKVGSQTEGCVADDELGVFYLGEENQGIWKFQANPDSLVEGFLIADTSNPNIIRDIEGLTIYYAKNGKGYLIASIQGIDSYAVFEREGDNKYLGSFTISDGNNIDGVQNTDGIDVCNLNLGPLFPDGIFVAQDGINTNDSITDNQNFKIISWKEIATAFQPLLIIDKSYVIEIKK